MKVFLAFTTRYFSGLRFIINIRLILFRSIPTINRINKYIPIIKKLQKTLQNHNTDILELKLRNSDFVSTSLFQVRCDQIEKSVDRISYLQKEVNSSQGALQNENHGDVGLKETYVTQRQFKQLVEKVKDLEKE